MPAHLSTEVLPKSSIVFFQLLETDEHANYNPPSQMYSALLPPSPILQPPLVPIPEEGGYVMLPPQIIAVTRHCPIPAVPLCLQFNFCFLLPSSCPPLPSSLLPSATLQRFPLLLIVVHPCRSPVWVGAVLIKIIIIKNSKIKI